MLDFASRRLTVRLGRSSNKSGLANGELVSKRANVVGRKTSSRRVSVRNSNVVRRAPSGAGGLHRGTSVRRTPSAVRRGASVRRARSSTRRNSKRMSVHVDGVPSMASTPDQNAESSPATTLNPDLGMSSAQPATAPVPSKSFFSKLTSRFRGRSKKSHPSSDSITSPTTFSPTNLSPVGVVPRSPPLRSPSPGSRVTFVGTPQATKAPDAEGQVHPIVDSPAPTATPDELLQKSELDEPEEIVDEGDEAGDEWVDADDDVPDPEPHTQNAISTDPGIDSMHTAKVIAQPVVPERASGETGVPLVLAQASSPENLANDQPQVVRLQADVLNDLARESIGVDVRVSQWLAVTPAVSDDEESKLDEGSRVTPEHGSDGAKSKVEAKRRPPHIVVPGSSSTLSGIDPLRVPLPPSPSPSTLPKANPLGLKAEESSPDSLVPPSPSIFLTPATHPDGFSDVPRQSEELLAVDSTQVPLPPSPSPSHVSLPQNDDASVCASPQPTRATVTRNGSVSTSGGRSLSTAPSTRGPTTPTSVRIPGHPAFAHFSFGGPRSPSLKIEDWEDGEEERRGRSLEVSGSKRRMRSTSPGLDAVLEGDESRRSSRASAEDLQRKNSPEAVQPSSPLPIVDEVTTFGRKSSDGKDTEHEDEDGFFAFAEQQLERQRQEVEARQSGAPKRSKTISFLSFGKRKGDLAAVPRPALPRSTTPSGLLSPPLPTPKRSSTLAAPAEPSTRISRLMPGQRSSTLLAPPAEPRVAVSPTMYTVGDIHAETGKIEDEESRRLSEAVFMF